MRIARALVMLGGAGTLVTGCASYHPAPLSPADNARTIESRRLDDPRLLTFVKLALPEGAAQDPPSRWGLPALTLAALYYHPDLEIAQARLRGAEAGVTTAAQRPNPSLSFEDLHYSAGPGTWVIAPVINFVLETFGKRDARTAQARHLVDGARWDLATAGWQVRGRVRTALVNLWAAQQRLALTGERLQLQDQLVGLLERRLAAGEAAALEVSRERINRAQITFALRDLERAEADARIQLATAIGVPAQALGGVAVALDVFDHPPPVDAAVAAGAWRKQALSTRSDVQASLQEYEAAQAALRLEIANQYPNVTLSPGYIYDAGSNGFLLLPALDLPVLNQNQGPIAQALARRQQAAASFTALQAQIIGAIDQAVSAYRAATRSVATGDALLADANRGAHEVERSFRAGETDRPTLVTAELEAATTALSRFDAVVQQRQAIGALEDALQKPLFDPGQWPVVPERSPRLADSAPP
jgi:outer membrane protein TolC